MAEAASEELQGTHPRLRWARWWHAATFVAGAFALLLQLWAGYSLNDIAAALGCNVTTIKTRVHRARARFRQLYVV